MIKQTIQTHLICTLSPCVSFGRFLQPTRTRGPNQWRMWLLCERRTNRWANTSYV